jgi:DNA-directed RNA polymerase sigma subunit (sigma70/sigma32)
VASPGGGGLAGAQAVAEVGPVGVLAALRRVPLRQRAVIALRFGLGGEPPRTLEEVGAVLGVSREIIRRLEVLALRRLRGWLEPAAPPDP